MTNTPFALLALGAVLAWRRAGGLAREFRTWLAAVLLMLGAGATLMCFFYGTCTRYQVEFHPELMLLAAIGAGAFFEYASGSRAARTGLALAFGVLVISSVAFGFLKTYQRTAERLLGQGIMAQDAGDLPRALANFDAATAARPHLVEPSILAAMALRQLGRLDEAIKRYELILAQRPNDVHAHNNLGNTLQKLGRYAEATPHYEAALALSPDMLQPNVNLGVCWLNLQQPAKAVPPLQRAVALDPRFADAHLDLAIALQSLGDLPAARASYQRARALNPALPELKW